jgi:hypothetical protein
VEYMIRLSRLAQVWFERLTKSENEGEMRRAALHVLVCCKMAAREIDRLSGAAAETMKGIERERRKSCAPMRRRFEYDRACALLADLESYREEIGLLVLAVHCNLKRRSVGVKRHELFGALSVPVAVATNICLRRVSFAAMLVRGDRSLYTCVNAAAKRQVKRVA